MIIYARALWTWLCTRYAVEWRRLFPVRRDGRHTETRAVVRRLDDQWADQLHAIATETAEPPVIVVENYDDPLREHIDAAWAYTGTTEAGYWADTRTANQRALLWKAREVMPERVIAALQAGSPERTVIDSDLTPETRTALVEEFAGGDPYSGEGEAWFDAFDRIQARMHERIAKARAELDQLFAGAAA